MAKHPTITDPINVVVGRRLRLKREMNGLSQSALGEIINVSRIKIGQYESGQSSIPASRLFKLAQFLNVDVAYFFNESDQSAASAKLEELDPMLNKLSVSLLRDFNALGNPEVSKSFAAVIERAAEMLNGKSHETND